MPASNNDFGDNKRKAPKGTYVSGFKSVDAFKGKDVVGKQFQMAPVYSMMPEERPDYAKEGFSRAYRKEASKYFDRHEKTGAYSEVKDGYISSQTPLQGMGKEVAHIKDDGYGGFYDDDETYNTYIYKKPSGEEDSLDSQATADDGSQPANSNPDRATAKERAQKFKVSLDGTAGTDFTAV